jgi:beta-barrel assembly-enhancing protease
VELSNGCLLIYRPETGLETWSLSSVQVIREPGTLRLVHNDTVLSLNGKDATDLHNAIQQPVTSSKGSGKFSFAVLSVIALAGLLITAGAVYLVYAWLPKLAERAAGLVPVEYEVKLGESMVQNLETGSATNDSANYYLSRFVSALRLDSRYPINARVIVSEEINAFAVPGGNIFVYSGLLEKMGSYEELVALLGHEVTHVVKRHSLRSLLSSAATGIVISTMLGNNGGLGNWALSQADQLKQLDYSRELETEADNYGLGIMTVNRVDPEGMLRLLHILKQESIEDPGLMKYLSTHPETEARIQNIRSNPALKSDFENDEYLEFLFRKLQLALANNAEVSE